MDGQIRQLLSPNKSQCLYIVELMIIGLNFESDKIIDEVNDDNSYLSIDLTFPNLPTFTINADNVKSSKKRKNRIDSDDFSTAGISCLFSKRPNDFSNMMEEQKSLTVDIYKKNIDPICQAIDDIDKKLICQAKIQFHRCLCDQFDMKLINDNNLPEPFEIRKAYELFDIINERCGTLELFTRISCCGTSITTQFYHDEKKFIFNDINSTDKFTCTRLLSAKEKGASAIINVPKAKTVVGVSKLCDDLRMTIDETPSTSIVEIKRMRGGGSHNQNVIPPIYPLSTMNASLSDGCVANHENKEAGFNFCGKSGIGLTKMEHGQSNNPCHGINCLTRALEDTQKFVDNIKVSGFSALGLMDPEERPYFGRNPKRIPNDLPPSSLSKKKSTEHISHNSKYINTLFDSSKRRNVRENHQMLIKSGEKTTDKGPDDDLYQSKKVLHENSTIYNEERPINPIKSISQSDANKFRTRHSTRKRKKKWTKKYRSQSQRIYSSQNGIKPSRKVMKLVRSVASRLHFGHKSCVDIRIRVPGNMGWLWNIKNTAGEPKAQMGWKPGAISSRVWRLLENARAQKSDVARIERPPTPIKRKKSKLSRKQSPFLLPRNFTTHRNEHDDEHELPPVLHVHRKAGTYYITLYPVKDEFLGKPELQENVLPLQFKVTKNKTNDDCDDSNVSSSITSDLEFEFSPPVADTRYITKVPCKNIGTQVQQQEIVDSINNPTPIFMKHKRRNQKIGKFNVN